MTSILMYSFALSRTDALPDLQSMYCVCLEVVHIQNQVINTHLSYIYAHKSLHR